MLHKYEVRDFSGRHERMGTHFSLPLILFVLLVIAVSCWIHDGLLGDEWKKRIEANQATIEQKDKDHAELLSKYQRAMCRHRKLVVTTVENTKLCMDPETKALFKIEKDKVAYEWSGGIPLNLNDKQIKNIWPGEDD